MTLVDAYILGSSFSGSTLLGNSLNAHPAVAHVGEVSRLPFFGHGLEGRECLLCAGRREPCPVWCPEVVERLRAAGPGGAAATLRSVTGAAVVVDSSKWVGWLRDVRAAAVAPSPARVRVLVAVRSPFAFASSFRRRERGAPAWQAANAWRDALFDALRFLGASGLPHMIVRYEDFATAPEPVLRRVCDFLDLAYDPGMLSFWQTDVHALGGNAGAYVWYQGYRHAGRDAGDDDLWTPADAALGERYRARGFGGWSDDKWRDELSAADRREVVQTPGLADLATLAGYDLQALLG